METPNTTTTSVQISDAAGKWLQRIDKGIKFRDNCKATKHWDRIDEYYAHENMGIEAVGTEEYVIPAFNLVYMFGRALIPSIVFQAPQITNTARRKEFIPTAAVLDSIDNWLVQEMEFDEVFRDVVRNGYLYNMGAVQLGWDMPQGVTRDAKDPIGKALRLAYGFERIPKCTNRARRYNFPWIDIIDPRNLIFAAGTKNVRTCHWYARKCIDRTESLSAYLNKTVKCTHVPKDFLGGDIEGTDKYPEEWTCYYQIHDALEKKWCMLSVDGEFILDWQDDMLQTDGLPLETVVFNEMPKSIWGTPDALYVEGQMLDGNDCRYQGLKQRRVAIVKALVDENLISKEEAEKLYSDDALPIIRVKPTGSKPISESVVLIQPHVQQELMAYQEKLIEDAQRILGFGPNQLGSYASGRRTRYEVQVVEDRNLSRTNERKEMVGAAIANMVRKINQLIIRNWKQPLVTRVIGVDLAQYWVTINSGDMSSEMLSDEISTTVDVASMGPQSAERIKQEAMQVLQLVGNIPGVNVYPIIRKLLSKFPWMDVDAVLPVQNSPESPMSMEQFNQSQKDLMQPTNDGKLQAQQKMNATSLQPLLLGSGTPAKPKSKVKGKGNASV